MIIQDNPLGAANCRVLVCLTQKGNVFEKQKLSGNSPAPSRSKGKML